jgi:hypothetical protein
LPTLAHRFAYLTLKTPFSLLSRAACKVDESEDSQKEFSESLTSTLTALTENMESLQGQLSEQEMMAALAGLNLGDAGPKPGEGT